ncbi:MAG TPA: class I SAM-dependent methyltransferase [Polyangiaceae bacterium]|nr:class I SAM-dependent methyltransferase [Polyangiaceae bacterium]
MMKPIRQLTKEELSLVRSRTLEHYERSVDAFWRGTKDHDVSQNIDALLRHIEASPPLSILDLGCGPGRDLIALRALGHEPVGLDGALGFVRMARERSGCSVLHQDLLALDLPALTFDGIFANAVLFHVPTQELPRVLRDLWNTLVPRGVLFVSNPRGPDIEEWHGLRYGSYLSWPTWRDYAISAGFEELEHYYRPPGRPRAEQPWLASVWRKLAA